MSRRLVRTHPCSTAGPQTAGPQTASARMGVPFPTRRLERTLREDTGNGDTGPVGGSSPSRVLCPAADGERPTESAFREVSVQKEKGHGDVL
jgi:hypothetical protein